MKARRIFSFCAQMITLFLFIYLLIFPQSATEPTRFALEFCGKTLIPSLFIYMVLSKMIVASPIINKLTKLLGLESVALILGTLCGCPIGAKNAVLLYDNGQITKKHAEYLCSFSNNASISFVIGFVGAEILGDIRLGIMLLIFQITASAITAEIMKFKMFGKEKLPQASQGIYGKTGLWEAVSDSAVTMVSLCACVVFFIVAGGVFTQLFSFSPEAEAVFKSMLEFSSGCVAAKNTGEYAFVISAFALGQMGGSVVLQVKSVVGNRFSIRPFLAGKLINGAVMTALAIIFG
ncbi:MAG: hypothetical protein E7586_03780 [Ruminococcaceae bacterium]|nr:hypothetical protein [Oscillospiraceae bacterium]